MFSAKQIERFGGGHSFNREMPPEIIEEMKRFELFMAEPYSDRGKVAQGYGHRETAGPPKIIMGSVWTEEYASKVFHDDLDREFGRIVKVRAKVPITNYMFGALVSLNYNCGPTRIFEETTIWQKLNAENYTDCALEFLTLNTSENPETKVREVLRGLTWRRATELAFFMKRIP